MDGLSALEDMRLNPGVRYSCGDDPGKNIELGCAESDLRYYWDGEEYRYQVPGNSYVGYASFNTGLILCKTWHAIPPDHAETKLSDLIASLARSAVNNPAAGPEYARGLLMASSIVAEAGL